MNANGVHEAEEQDEVVKWQRCKRRVRWHSYKETIATIHIQDFLGNQAKISSVLLSGSLMCAIASASAG